MHILCGGRLVLGAEGEGLFFDCAQSESPIMREGGTKWLGCRLALAAAYDVLAPLLLFYQKKRLH